MHKGAIVAFSYCVRGTACPYAGIQCFQIKITKHGKTRQNDYFLQSISKFFLLTMELALGHYNPVYSVSSGIYKKRQKILWTLCIYA